MLTLLEIEKLALTVSSRINIAAEYGICTKTLIESLSRKGVILPSGPIFPKTRMLIYHTLGSPPYFKIS